MFIIEGSITVLFAILTAFSIPDYPATSVQTVVSSTWPTDKLQDQVALEQGESHCRLSLASRLGHAHRR